MIADALESDEQIGMVLLKPGWESAYYGSPAVHTYGTVGHIEKAVKFDDGRYNIVVHGTVRFRIVDWIAQDPYRVARVVIDPERESSPMEAYAQREWLVELSKRYIEFLPGQMEVPELASVSLDSLTNALIMSLDMSPHDKQDLLEINDVLSRAERVGGEIESRISSLRFLSSYRRETDPSTN